MRSKRTRSTREWRGAAGSTYDGQVGQVVVGGDAAAGVGDVDDLDVQVGRPGVDARQLEQVEDHAGRTGAPGR